MKSRHLLHQSWPVTVAQICWLLAVLMMFVFVRTAAGADGAPAPPHSIWDATPT